MSGKPGDRVNPAGNSAWKRLPVGAALLLLLLGALGVMLFSDARLLPYEDLPPPRTEVPGADSNGFLYLRERWENRDRIRQSDRNRLAAIRRGAEPADGALIASLRKGREETRAEFSRALSMPAWRILPPDQPFEKEVSGWLADPLTLFMAEAETALKAGDAGPAVILHQEMVTLARRQLDSGGGLMSLMLSGFIQTQAAEFCCDILAQGHPDEAALRELEKAWRDDPPMAKAGRSALRSEAQFFTGTIDALRSGRMTPEMGREFPAWKRFLIQRNRTLNLHHAMIRKMLPSLFQPFPDRRTARAAGLGVEGDDRSFLRRVLDPNFVGGNLARSNGDSLIILHAYRTLFVPRAMRVRLAVHRWRQAHPGQWPSALTELVPDDLPEVPKDPWNGGPLLWDSVRRIVYAVGVDWKPDVPVFKSESRAWLAPDLEAPGLRMELPSVPVPVFRKSKGRAVLSP